MSETKLAVFFPGLGYNCDKPLLYYSRKLVTKAGYTNTVCLNYRYEKAGIQGNRAKMLEAFDNIYEQAKISLEDIEWEKYDDILFVSKSIGTAVATVFANKNNLSVKHVLYTPLEETYMNNFQNAIAFIGTKDPWSDVSKVITSSQNIGVPIYVIDGANHSLETEDTLNNIKIISEVMEETNKFIL